MSTHHPLLKQYVRTGAEADFRAMVDQHLPMILQAARARLGQFSALAPDVAQGVFIRLARQARLLAPEIVLGAWLHRQSQRLAMDAVRSELRRQRREQIAFDAINEPTPLPNDDAALLPALHEAIDTLSKAEREVITLRFLDGLRVNEVAARLGISEDAAQKRVARAMEQLRGKMQRLGAKSLSAATLVTLFTLPPQPLPAGLAHSITQKACASAAGISLSMVAAFIAANLAALGLGAAAALVLTALTLVAWPQVGVGSDAGIPVDTAAGKLNPTRPAPHDASASLPASTSLEEIIASLRLLASQPKTSRVDWETKRLLGLIRPEAYLEFLTQLNREVPGPFHDQVLAIACDLWREKFPAELVQALVASDAGKSYRFDGLNSNCLTMQRMHGHGRSGQNRLARVFGSWLYRDPQAAEAWLLSNWNDTFLEQKGFGWVGDDQSIRGDLFELLLKHSSDRSPSEMWRLLAMRPDQTGKLAGKIFGHSRSHASDAHKDYATLVPIIAREAMEVPDDERTGALISSATFAWTSADAVAAMEWLKSLPADSPIALDAALGCLSVAQKVTPTPEGIDMTAYSAGERLTFLHAAVERAGDLPPARLYEKIVEAWQPGGQSDKNQALLSWLAEHNAQGAADEALAEGARQLGQLSYQREETIPQAVLWAQAISNESERRQILRGIYRGLLDLHDDAGKVAWPVEAETYVADLPRLPLR